MQLNYFSKVKVQDGVAFDLGPRTPPILFFLNIIIYIWVDLKFAYFIKTENLFLKIL